MAFFGPDRLTARVSQVPKAEVAYGNVLKAEAYRYPEFR